MTIKVYVWSKKGGSVLNYLAYMAKNVSSVANHFLDFHTSVGHAAIEVDIGNLEPHKNTYISHRPLLSEEKNNTNGNAFILKDIIGQPCISNDNFTYNDECSERGNASYFKVFEGLDENLIIDTYVKYRQQYFSYYHGLENNCCKVVYRLVKAGLRCPFNKECSFCTAYRYTCATENSFENVNIVSGKQLIDNFLFAALLTLLINNGLFSFAKLFLRGNTALSFFEGYLDSALMEQNKGIVASTLQHIRRPLIEAWTPNQIIYFLQEIDSKNIKECQKT